MRPVRQALSPVSRANRNKPPLLPIIIGAMATPLITGGETQATMIGTAIEATAIEAIGIVPVTTIETEAVTDMAVTTATIATEAEGVIGTEETIAETATVTAITIEKGLYALYLESRSLLLTPVLVLLPVSRYRR